MAIRGNAEIDARIMAAVKQSERSQSQLVDLLVQAFWQIGAVYGIRRFIIDRAWLPLGVIS